MIPQFLSYRFQQWILWLLFCRHPLCTRSILLLQLGHKIRRSRIQNFRPLLPFCKRIFPLHEDHSLLLENASHRMQNSNWLYARICPAVPNFLKRCIYCCLNCDESSFWFVHSLLLKLLLTNCWLRFSFSLSRSMLSNTFAVRDCLPLCGLSVYEFFGASPALTRNSSFKWLWKDYVPLLCID